MNPLVEGMLVREPGRLIWAGLVSSMTIVDLLGTTTSLDGPVAEPSGVGARRAALRLGGGLMGWVPVALEVPDWYEMEPARLGREGAWYEAGELATGEVIDSRGVCWTEGGWDCDCAKSKSQRPSCKLQVCDDGLTSPSLNSG